MQLTKIVVQNRFSFKILNKNLETANLLKGNIRIDNFYYARLLNDLLLLFKSIINHSRTEEAVDFF